MPETNIIEFVVSQAEKGEGPSLDTLAEDVISGFEADWDSRKDWMEANQMWLDLVLQYVEHKTWPWPNASNIKFPLISMAALAFQSRVYPVMVHSTNLVRCLPVGGHSSENYDRAKRVAAHLNYQLLEQMEEWEEQTDRMLFILPIIGTMFRKTYYDPVEQRNASDLVTPDALVVNYYANSLAAAPRLTHVLFEQAHEIETKLRAGIYEGLEEIDITGETVQPSRVEHSKQEADKRLGVTKPGSHAGTLTVPNCLLEQHTRLDLDGDGYAEPVIITVHYASRKVVRIVNNYDDASVVVDSEDPERIVKINPVTYYTKFGFIPNPDSAIYDLGFGQLAGPINVSINTVLNQLVDAGTLSNVQAGFLARGIKLKKGERAFTPGEFKQTQLSSDELQGAVLPLPTKEPSMVLYQLLVFLVEVGRQLTSTMDSMMGENPGQNQPGVTTLAVMEAGMKIFQSIFKRIHRSFKQEFKKLFRLNALYLDETEYFRVVGEGSDIAEGAVRRTDYDPAFMSVVPYSDPSIVSATSKLLRVQSLGQLLQLGTINPTEYTRRYLDALEEQDIDALMTVPQAQPPLELTLKQMQLEFERWKVTVQEANRAEQIKSEGVKDQAVAILAMAKAQSEEVNRNIRELQAQLKGLGDLVNLSKGQATPVSEPSPPASGMTEADMTSTPVGNGLV